MRYNILFFVVLSYLVNGCNEGQNPADNSNTDSVVILPAKHDLGKIDSTRIVALSFEIVNKSDNDVKIVSKAKSCGCTNFVLPSDKLKAKSRMKVKVDFDPKQVSGNFEKSVFFRLENGKILMFKFSGTVIV